MDQSTADLKEIYLHHKHGGTNQQVYELSGAKVYEQTAKPVLQWMVVRGYADNMVHCKIRNVNSGHNVRNILKEKDGDAEGAEYQPDNPDRMWDIVASGK